MHDLRALAGFFASDVDRGFDRLRDRTQDIFGDNEDLQIALLVGLRRECFEICHRTLIGYYSLVKKSVSFGDYCSTIASPEGRAHILAKYPVLARLLNQLIDQWVDRVSEIIVRFLRDRNEIEHAIFASSPLSHIVDIQFGLGDRHRGGRAVALLIFGDGRKLIYKPRSMSVDAHFASFLSHISERISLSFITPTIVFKDNYGWAEFIEHTPCDNDDEAEQYYERLGAILAALYVLNAFDFHYENIVAHGSNPVLIDLETFFHPQAPIIGTETNTGIDDSVLMSGLLPDEIILGDGRSADISGMADVAGKDGVVDRLTLRQDDTGEFIFERERGKLLGAKNTPMINGAVAEPTPARVGRLRAGFERAYRAIAERSADFIALAEDFSGDEVRVIFRPTLTYTHMLDESRHPALLLSEDRLEQYFRSLSKLSLDYALGEVLIPFEIDDFRRRDVPMFSCRVGSTGLKVNDATEVDRFFVSDGLDLVRRKIAGLDEDDLSRQLWIINKSFKIAAGAILRLPQKPAEATTIASTRPLAERYMAQATNIADYVCDSVHEGDRHASWLVMKSLDEDNSRLAIWSSFYDLFGGMPGEIAFLAQMYNITGNDRYNTVAKKAYRFLHDRLIKSKYAIRPLGLFGGWGSVLFLATALGRWTGDTAYHDDAESLLEMVDFPTLISVDRNFAMVKGSAGFLLACAEHIRSTGSERALDLANTAFEHLLQHREDKEGPLSWRITSERPLSGLSHGASGFATCFARMFEVTRNERYRDACLSALEFERTLFLPEVGNWLDQRDYAQKFGPRSTAMSWAHGAPGIGIARLAILKSGIVDDAICADLHAAMRSTLAAGPSGGISAVSGDFGTIELPIGYAEKVGSEYWNGTYAKLEILISDLEERTMSLSENDSAAIGLMNGVTGAGYQCLRIGSATPVASLLGLHLDAAQRSILHDAAPSGYSQPHQLGGEDALRA